MVNADDKIGRELIFNAEVPTVSYGIDNPCDVFAVDEEESERGIKYVLNCYDELYDIETALILYTKESAEIAGFKGLGQLKEGYKADFLILDRDLLEISPKEIDQISVAETYIGGRCVYRKAASVE